MPQGTVFSCKSMPPYQFAILFIHPPCRPYGQHQRIKQDKQRCIGRVDFYADFAQQGDKKKTDNFVNYGNQRDCHNQGKYNRHLGFLLLGFIFLYYVGKSAQHINDVVDGYRSVAVLIFKNLGKMADSVRSRRSRWGFVLCAEHQFLLCRHFVNG
nr:MAG TPA_asm: hypothetical protein [Caudoviricetes sp.]